MSKVEKRLRKWALSPPREAPISQVDAVLKRYFSGRFEKKRGSHIVIMDERLEGMGEFGPTGELTIPVKSGQKVKGIYLKRLALAVSLVERGE